MRKKTKVAIGRTVQHILLCIVIASVGFVLIMSLLVREVPQQTKTDYTQLVHVPESARLQFFESIRLVAQQNQREYGVFASVTMAQAALESHYGTSGLATNYYNLFGVKGTPENGVLLPTLEFIDGKYVEIQDYFVVYTSWDESIVAHGQLLYHGTPWNANQYRDVIIAKNYHDAALGLVSGGYATDPHYAEKVVQMIEQYELYQYD